MTRFKQTPSEDRTSSPPPLNPMETYPMNWYWWCDNLKTLAWYLELLVGLWQKRYQQDKTCWNWRPVRSQGWCMISSAQWQRQEHFTIFPEKSKFIQVLCFYSSTALDSDREHVKHSHVTNLWLFSTTKSCRGTRSADREYLRKTWGLSLLSATTCLRPVTFPVQNKKS